MKSSHIMFEWKKSCLIVHFQQVKTILWHTSVKCMKFAWTVFFVKDDDISCVQNAQNENVQNTSYDECTWEMVFGIFIVNSIVKNLDSRFYKKCTLCPVWMNVECYSKHNCILLSTMLLCCNLDVTFYYTGLLFNTATNNYITKDIHTLAYIKSVCSQIWQRSLRTTIVQKKWKCQDKEKRICASLF